jgi:hypothetical protein
MACPLAVLAVVAQLVAAGPRRYQVTVESARPLAVAAQILQEEYQIPVTYEDPPYVHESTIVNSPSPRRTLIPRPHAFTFEYEEVSPDSKARDEQARHLRDLLRTVVEGYNRVAVAGCFAVREGEGRFHIVPVEVVGREGSLEEWRPILEEPVTFRGDPRTGQELLVALCESVERTRDLRVQPGNAPGALGQPYEAGAIGDSFGANLERMGARFHGSPLSWRLLYGTDNVTRGYALNLHGVMPGRGPSGEEIQEIRDVTR